MRAALGDDAMPCAEVDVLTESRTSTAAAHGVMFHHFHGGPHPPVQGSISAHGLDAIIEYLDPKRFLMPDEWMHKVMDGILEVSDLCLTFDDGLLCQYEVALPVLENHGLKAFWFPYSCVFHGTPGLFEVYRRFRCTFFASMDEFYDQFFELVASRFGVESDGCFSTELLARHPFYTVNDVKFRIMRDDRLTEEQYQAVHYEMMRHRGVTVAELTRGLWMSEDHLRELSQAGHRIGLHSYSHPMVLGRLPAERQQDEYERNLAHLTEVCGSAPLAMAHPANSYTGVTLEVLAGLGIRCGFRSTMAPPQPNGRLNPSALEIAREDHADILRRLLQSETEMGDVCQ